MIDNRKTISDIINSYIDNIPGWTPFDELFSLFHLAYTTSSVKGDILEIGSWCGRSTAVLALASHLLSNGKVFSVDLFPSKNDWYQNIDGSYSFKVDINGESKSGYNIQTVWQEPFENDIAPIYQKYNSIYDYFIENIKKYSFIEKVSAYRGTAEMFINANKQDLSIRLAFIDGDHSYAAVSEDIKLIHNILLPGGWIAFDDAFSCYDGVDKAINDHIINSGNYDSCQQIARKYFIARKK